MSRVRWLLGLITEECKWEEEWGDNSWISNEVSDWFLGQSLETGNPEGRVDSAPGWADVRCFEALTWRFSEADEYISLEIKGSGLRKQIWESSAFPWSSSYNRRSSQEAEAGEINAKTKPYVIYQNFKKERVVPAKKPTHNVRERRRIDQQRHVSHRRHGSRRVASGVKPVGEEKGPQLKRALWIWHSQSHWWNFHKGVLWRQSQAANEDKLNGGSGNKDNGLVEELVCKEKE